MDLIDYNNKCKSIMNQIQWKIKIDLDKFIVCTIEENVMDTRNNKLSNMVNVDLYMKQYAIKKY